MNKYHATQSHNLQQLYTTIPQEYVSLPSNAYHVPNLSSANDELTDEMLDEMLEQEVQQVLNEANLIFMRRGREYIRKAFNSSPGIDGESLLENLTHIRAEVMKEAKEKLMALKLVHNL